MFDTLHISDFFDVPLYSPHVHINRLEDMPPLPARIKSPHKHLFYEVLLVKSGFMEHNVDYEEFKISGNTLFFISQGQLHLWSKAQRETLRGYRLMFTEDFFAGGQEWNQFLFELIYLDNVYQTPVLPLTQSNSPIFQYFDLMHQEFLRSNWSESALRSFLVLILTETQRLAHASRQAIPEKQHVIVYKRFIQLLETHFTERWTVEHYASALHITPRNLNRVLQEVAQQNFSDIVQHRGVLEAKRLLKFTGLSINEISFRLGFEDSSYFSRNFKKNTFQSPLQFRRQSLENT